MTRPRGPLRDFRKFDEALREAGWTYDGKTGRGHLRYRAPAGHDGPGFITMPSTPGHGRGSANFRAMLKRVCGIDITHRKEPT